MLFKNVLLLATLATSATALPGMGAGPDGEQLQKKRGCPFGFDKLSKKAAMPEAAAAAGSEHEAHEKRILGLGETVGNLVGGVGDLLDGLVGSLASLGNGEVRVPDADHPFQEPGPSDQRGPCPGLNALANHGYISRSGIVTAGEVIEGVNQGFNMGPDLAALLVFIATAFGGNIESLTFSLGGEDDRTYSQSGIGAREAGRQLGLSGHSRCEGDISAMRRDFFTNNGDNHNAYPDRFKRFIELAKQNGGEFNLAAANAFYAQNAAESVANNDQLFFNSYTILVVLGEYPFIPAFFGNGTEGAGGVANYESISSFYGMQTNDDGTICYVPERFPENWYRRATPYGVAQFVAGLGPTYLNGPVLPNPVGILQNPGQAPEIGCAIYQGVTSGIPAALLGEANDKLSQTVNFITDQLLPQLPSVYGCSPDAPSLQANGSGGEQYNLGAATGGQSYSQICA